MEGQRSFRGFRSRNESKLPILSPQRATKEYKYGTSGSRPRRGEPGEGFGFGKKTERTTFSSSPNIRKFVFLVSRAGTDPFLSGTVDTTINTPSFIVVSYNTPFILPYFFLYEFL